MNNDPYKLPDGPIAIQFSGGRTSGYMLWHILDRYDGKLPSDCHVMFANTGREMPETLDFVHECQTRWSVPVTWLEGQVEEPRYKIVSHNSAARDGEPFLDYILNKFQRSPNRVARWCTKYLKIEPITRYLRYEVGFPSSYHAALGIRADEPKRVEATPAANQKPFYPLFDAGVRIGDVARFWKKQPFDLGLDMVKGKTPLGNCDGCMLRSEKKRAHFARYYPERAEWWAKIEDMGDEYKFTPPDQFTWRELLDHAHRQQDWVFEQENDVYCDVGFGGCHD